MDSIRIVVAVGSGMITLACLSATVFIFTIAEWYKGIPTLLIACVFGLFTARDISAFLSKPKG